MSSSLFHPLLQRPPEDIIAHAGGCVVRVDELLGAAAALAGSLPDRRYVFNLCGNRYEFLLGFCAAVMAGQCTLMPPNRQPQTLREIAARYPDNYQLGPEPLAGIESAHFVVPQAGRLSEPPLIADELLCGIAFTSGSTGEPQPNRKLWRTLRVGGGSSARLLFPSVPQRINMLATVPPQHMWGFELSIMLPLITDIAVSELTPLFPQDIHDALAVLPRPRALVSSPIHLATFLEADIGPLEIDYVFTASAPLPPATAETLEVRHGSIVTDVFGSTEAGVLASRRLTQDEIWTLADAYELSTDDSAATWIHARHLGERVPLNDRVEIPAPGRFRWVGRTGDMVNIAGKRGSLADLNQRLGAIPGVEDGVIFMPEPDAKRLAALVVAPSMQVSGILAELRDSIDPAFLPRPVYRVPALPRQETGKLAQKAVLDLFSQTRRQRRKPG